jgi:D-alanine-D-alanine ligase
MKTVAVFFGGRSTEHDVSIVTALSSVIKPLELTKKYEVAPVYIAKDGSWYCGEELKNIATYSSGEIEEYMKKQPKVTILFDDGLVLQRKQSFGKIKNIRVDVAFSAMHGTYGEDGSLMGLLRMANVPYVGCDMASSVIAMDKVLAKQLAAQSDISITKYVFSTASEYEKDAAAFIEKIKSLQFPVFVKPAHLGSSIGITRVKTIDELENALEVAFHYDKKVLVEEEVANLVEVTLPIIGNESPVPALLERPLTQSDEFFDFETKYMHGGKKSGAKSAKAGAQGYSELPAKLSQKLYDQAVVTGLDVYKSFECSGIARVDMLIDSKTEQVYFNEINPLPGDLYRHNWRMAGISSIELVEKLITYAEDAFAANKKYETIFSTNYLKQF